MPNRIDLNRMASHRITLDRMPLYRIRGHRMASHRIEVHRICLDRIRDHRIVLWSRVVENETQKTPGNLEVAGGFLFCNSYKPSAITS